MSSAFAYNALLIKNYKKAYLLLTYVRGLVAMEQK